MSPLKVLLAGLTATIVMTAFMVIAPLAGLPRMDAGEILGSMFGGIKAIGWVEHFIAGIIFAFVYARFANNLLPVENNIARGAIYGILLFILSEAVYMLVSFLGYMSWHEKESMALMVSGEVVACMIYGSMLGIFIKKQPQAKESFS